MITRLIRIDPENPDPAIMAQAASLISGGDIAAFPTETVYGLGANALDEAAVQRVFAVKSRPSDNPQIVHIAALGDLDAVARDVPARAWNVAKAFWPGPVTVVLVRSPRVPLITTGGFETVAVRMPAHPVALALIRTAGCPVAAPSANRSGRPSPTRAEHVMEDLGGLIPMILDAGPCTVGVESTVVDLTCDPPIILRHGGLSAEALQAVIGHVQLCPGPGSDPPRGSPGTRYAHYAPHARLLLAERSAMATEVRRLLEDGKTVGVMARRRLGLEHPLLRLRMMPDDMAQYAQHLFSAMRELDALKCDVIVAEAPEDESGIGRAIADRLRRAAEPRSPSPDP